MTVDLVEDFIQMPLNAGDKILRLLPPRKGDKLFYSIRIHRVAPKGLSFKNYHCHKELINNKWEGNCVICDKYAEFWRNFSNGQVPYFYKGNLDEFRRDIGEIKPNERHYYNAIERDNDEKTGILSIGKFVHATIMKSIVGDEHTPPLGDVTNIKTGRDFILRKRVVNGSFPSYDGSCFAAETSPLGTKQQIKKWQSEMHDLTQRRNLSPQEEMRQSLIDMFGDFDTPEKKNIKAIKEILRNINEPFEPSYYA